MIIRAVHNKENPYCMVKRSTAQDSRLPARALGLLIYLMSKPDDWEPTIPDICRRFPDIGKNQCYRIINEIFIPLGYARRVPERKNGKIARWVTEIYEEPVPHFGEIENPQNQTEPVPQNGELVSSSPFLDPQNGELHINRVQSKDLLQEQNKEQQAGRDSNQLPAAANSFNDAHSSRHPFPVIEAFVTETKPHIKNPGGLARVIWRSGVEDAAIERWLKKEERRELEENSLAEKRMGADLNDFDWDGWITTCIESGWLDQLKSECEQILKRGGPVAPHEFRVIAYLNNPAASEAA